MKTATVSCFIILLFAQLLSGSALELTHALIDTSLDMSRDSNMGQERNGSRSSVDLKTDDIGDDFESSHAMELRKAQKGKGAYGGANVVHRPPGTRSLGSPTLISSSRSSVNLKTDDNGEDFKSRHPMVLKKSQGHKGSSGGAPNIVHRPPETRSLGPPTLISTTVVYFSFILLLVFIA